MTAEVSVRVIFSETVIEKSTPTAAYSVSLSCATPPTIILSGPASILVAKSLRIAVWVRLASASV